jgi:hypothetical protein
MADVSPSTCLTNRHLQDGRIRHEGGIRGLLRIMCGNSIYIYMYTFAKILKAYSL